MASKRAQRRMAAASRLAAAVQLFCPEHVAEFLCPTCLAWLPLSDAAQITEAHIVPDAAGGRETTLLCRKCNNSFGTARDKWLGEYLHVAHSAEGTFMNAKTQRGFFHIGDAKVGGEYSVTPDGNFDFLIFANQTSPDALKALPSQFGTTKIVRSLSQDAPVFEEQRRWTVTVPMPPLISKQDDVMLGFLTAAYLMWFRELGYSWCLQHHLNIGRKQILSDTADVLPRSAVGAVNHNPIGRPWIGFGKVNGQLALMTCIEDHMILFPPADDPDFYASLPASYEGAKVEVLGNVRFNRMFDGPHGVAFHDRLVVCPDVFRKGAYPVIFIAPDNSLQYLTPITQRQAEQLRSAGHRPVKMRPNVSRPKTDTDR